MGEVRGRGAKPAVDLIIMLSIITAGMEDTEGDTGLAISSFIHPLKSQTE